MTCGRIDNYWWYDLDEMPMREALLLLHPKLIGLCAVNTSFDSGLYGTHEELPPGWERCEDKALSPPITPDLIAEWPVSHDEFCDEWYFFKERPRHLVVTAYCNYLGCTINSWKELEFAGGANLSSSLATYAPELVVGNNEKTYAVSKNQLSEVSAQQGVQPDA